MFCWMIKYQSTECTDGLSNNDWYECTSKLKSSILSWEYKTWTHEGQNITCFKLEIVTTTINWKVKQKLIKIQQHHLNFQHNFFRIIVLYYIKLFFYYISEVQKLEFVGNQGPLLSFIQYSVQRSDLQWQSTDHQNSGSQLTIKIVADNWPSK